MLRHFQDLTHQLGALSQTLPCRRAVQTRYQAKRRTSWEEENQQCIVEEDPAPCDHSPRIGYLNRVLFYTRAQTTTRESRQQDYGWRIEDVFGSAISSL